MKLNKKVWIFFLLSVLAVGTIAFIDTDYAPTYYDKKVENFEIDQKRIEQFLKQVGAQTLSDYEEFHNERVYTHKTYPSDKELADDQKNRKKIAGTYRYEQKHNQIFSKKCEYGCEFEWYEEYTFKADGTYTSKHVDKHVEKIKLNDRFYKGGLDKIETGKGKYSVYSISRGKKTHYIISTNGTVTSKGMKYQEDYGDGDYYQNNHPWPSKPEKFIQVGGFNAEDKVKSIWTGSTTYKRK